MDEYKAIPGFPNYSVNNKGDVLNRFGRVLSPYKDAVGYVFIKLQGEDGARSTLCIHRLVYLAHQGEIPAGMWINHKNGIKADNRIENLEITTPSHNHLHARDVLKRRYARGEAVGGSKLTEQAAEAVRALHKAGWSQRKLAVAFQVSQPAISHIISGQSW